MASKQEKEGGGEKRVGKDGTESDVSKEAAARVDYKLKTMITPSSSGRTTTKSGTH